MSFLKFCFFLFFIFISFALHAQIPQLPQFTVDQVFFPGEAIRSVSLGSQGVWVVKGNDSLGLGKLDPNGISHDYSSQVQAVNNSPIAFLQGKYGNDALFATKEKLFWFKDGVVSEMNATSAGIEGSKILGIESDETPYTKILTNINVFISYDDKVFKAHENFIQNPQHLLGGGLIFFHEGVYCSFGPQYYKVHFKDNTSGYSGVFDYDSSRIIHDFAFSGPSYLLAQYIAHSKGLMIKPFSCNDDKRERLKDTAAYCIKQLDNYMLVGTEQGLFYGLTFAYNAHNNTYSRYNLPLNNLSIYSLVLEKEKGIIWLGTNQGLVRLKYDNGKTIDEFLTNPLWVHKIQSNKRDKANDIISDKKGNIYITGSYSSEAKFNNTYLRSSNSEDFFITKCDNEGKTLWLKTATTSDAPGMSSNEQGRLIATDLKENVYCLGNIYVEYPYSTDSIFVSFNNSSDKIGAHSSFLIKYDKNGNVVWKNYLNFIGNSEMRDLKTDGFGNVYILIYLSSWNTMDLPEGYAIIKYDTHGKILWKKSYMGGNSYTWKDPRMSISEFGKIYLTGGFDYSITFGSFKITSNKEYSFFIVSMDSNGDVVHGNSIARTQYGYGGSIAGLSYDKSGNVFISGTIDGPFIIENKTFTPPSFTEHSFLIKLNPQLKPIWGIRFGNTFNINKGNVITDSLGFSIVSGTYNSSFKASGFSITAPDSKNHFYYFKVDPNGNVLWLKNYSGYSQEASPYVFSSLCLDHENNIVGFLNSEQNLNINGVDYLNSGDTDILFFKLSDSLNDSRYNTIRGKIFHDKDNNQSYNSTDDGLDGILVKAMPGEIYSQSDQNGDFVFYLTKGNYTLEQIIPDNKGVLISQLSPVNNGKYSIGLLGVKKDTSGFNFADKAVLAPYLTVDINSIRRRRCFRGTTQVKYCNEGFLPASDVKINIEFPEYVIPMSSITPWTSRAGKILTYNIGTVSPGDCGMITIVDSVQCGDESILGITQCVKATITPPNNVVSPNPDWDRSDLELKAICKDNGFINVVLKNKGAGNMSDSTKFKILLDTTIIFKKNIKLRSGDSISLNIPANGKSLRSEVAQTLHHPAGHPASITMEGCKGDEFVLVSKGYTNQFAPNDQEEEVEISCMEIVGSMDPNDKQVIPKGITDFHYIEEDAELEYILRFMNKGTDTAFTVKIVDTLSYSLDIRTFKPGITSHPCQWKISGEVNPVLTCTFNNINLPDSITNEMASHGFAKFTIRHKENIKGQQIKNKAEIYFDYNSPVVTNEVLSTIGLPPLPEKKINIQQCTKPIQMENETISVHLCEVNETEISVAKNDTTYSFWQVTDGNGQLEQVSFDKTKVKNIQLGKNQYVLKNQYCDAIWSNIVIVERYNIPSTPSDVEYSYCEDDIMNLITVSGTNIEWYDDLAFKNKIQVGNNYLPAYGQSHTFYVKQTVDDCESKPAVVSVIYKERPAAPTTSSYIYCFKDTDKFATAEGENITWYQDTLSFIKIGTGNKLTRDLSSGDSLVVFATQTIDGCESKASVAYISVKQFNIEEVYIPNIINSTENEYFYLPSFITNECIGAFENVQLFDQTGRMIFYSENEKFQWSPLNTKGRLFLFHIKFSDQVYKGKLLVEEY